jgi:hypothetical protein
VTWAVGSGLPDALRRWRERVQTWRIPQDLAEAFMEACKTGDIGNIERMGLLFPHLHFGVDTLWQPPRDHDSASPAEHLLANNGLGLQRATWAFITPLQAALYGTHPKETIECLLNLGADPNLPMPPPRPAEPADPRRIPHPGHLPVRGGEVMPLLMELSQPTHPYRRRIRVEGRETTCLWPARFLPAFVLLSKVATPRTLQWKDQTGRGILHYAVECPGEGGLELCRTLLEAGAPPCMKDAQGRLPSDSGTTPTLARAYLKVMEERATLEAHVAPEGKLTAKGPARRL